MAVKWPDGVRKLVRRDGFSGEIPVSVISDQTRCGRRKRRPALQCQPQEFNVSMVMTAEEFFIFKNWYDVNLYHGALTFVYPKIDAINGPNVEYAFSPNSGISWTNDSGKIIKVSMKWEEV